MIKSILKKAIVLIAAVCLVFLATTTVDTAFAGSTGRYIADSTTFETEGAGPNYMDWYYAENRGIEFSGSEDDKTIRFTKKSDIGNALVSRTYVEASSDVETCLSGTVGLRINEIVGRKSFGILLGSPTSVVSYVNVDGITYLYFALIPDGQGGYTDQYGFGITSYGESGAETVLKELTALPAGVTKDDIKVNIILTNEGVLTVSFGDSLVYDGTGSKGVVNAEGYFGFAQDGGVTTASRYIDVEITDLNILNEYYERPEAPDVFSDFTNNEFNVKYWYVNASAYAGRGVVVEDEKLFFDGVNMNNSVVSEYSYSNFEITMDVSGALNKAVKDENGKVIRGVSDYFAIGFGANKLSRAGTMNSEYAGYMLHFSTTMNATTGERSDGFKTRARLYAYKDVGVLYGKTAAGPLTSDYVLPDNCDFFGADFDPEKEVTIRLRVFDGTVTFSCKAKEEAAFTTLFTYDLYKGYTPKGYLKLVGYSNSHNKERLFNAGTTLKLDNISVVNIDRNPNRVDVEYESNIPKYLPDYEYVDDWVYASGEIESTDNNKKGCGGAKATAVVLPLLSLGALLLIKRGGI